MKNFTVHIESCHDLAGRKLHLEKFRKIFLEIKKQIGNKEDCVELLFTNQIEMQKLNFEFRKKNKPTDVLSFPSDRHPLLGSIVVDLETAEIQAKEFSHSLEQECLELLIHGVLHLYGFDHETAPESDFMSFYENHFISQIKKL